MNGVLKIFENINKLQINTQSIAQTTADIAAILGHASL